VLGMSLDREKTEDLLVNSPKQNISEYLGSITRLQGSLNTLSLSNIRSTEKVQIQMVMSFYFYIDYSLNSSGWV